MRCVQASSRPEGEGMQPRLRSSLSVRAEDKQDLSAGESTVAWKVSGALGQETLGQRRGSSMLMGGASAVLGAARSVHSVSRHMPDTFSVMRIQGRRHSFIRVPSKDPCICPPLSPTHPFLPSPLPPSLPPTYCVAAGARLAQGRPADRQGPCPWRTWLFSGSLMFWSLRLS